MGTNIRTQPDSLKMNNRSSGNLFRGLKINYYRLIFIIVFTMVIAACKKESRPASEAPDSKKVDFRYSVPWWQTSVCLPDDPDKPLVGKEGQYFFDFKRGGPRNFAFSLTPQIDDTMKWIRQETWSAKVPIVRTWYEANSIDIQSEVFLTIPENLPVYNIPGSALTKEGRCHAVILKLKNSGARTKNCHPVMVIEGVEAVAFKKETGSVFIGANTRLLASEQIKSCEKKGNQWLIKTSPHEIQPGDIYEVAFTILRGSQERKALSVSEALNERDNAIKWWESAELPWNAIQVPDTEIQGILQSCIRNIWQAREIRNGQPAFQVGPTVYRGLWIVDGAFLLEAAALLGRAEEARSGINYTLSFQKPDGSFEILQHYWKENGIVLWTCYRHAILTNDKAWLGSVWPKMENAVSAIKHLRERSRTEPPGLDDGLMPEGFTDGGIGGDKHEYSNVYWNLAGLKAAIAAADWLGKKDEAADWRKEYDDFMSTFRKTARRDMAVDSTGNRYLPTVMGDEGRKYSPQRGQWAFMHAVYPGQIFAKDDSLVQDNLAMLRATKKEGLVFGTGWAPDGIWTYAASFYGHAVLWQGEGQEAAQVLYDYANHSAPVRAWREEQLPVGKGNKEVGDMPHNWASAEFIRLTAHIIEIDRGDELHLFEGLPVKWTLPGMRTRLNRVATPFGQLTMSLEIAADGKSAKLEVDPLDPGRCKRIIVHTGVWSGHIKDKLIELKPGIRNQININL